MSADNPFTGNWSYQSRLNDPDVTADFDKLEFGCATIVIEDGPVELLKGTIGGTGWWLALHGSRAHGSPMQVRFQGKGIVSGSEWIATTAGGWRGCGRRAMQSSSGPLWWAR